MTDIKIKRKTKRSERVSFIRREAREVCRQNSALTNRIRYFTIIFITAFLGIMLLTDKFVYSVIPKIFARGSYEIGVSAVYILGFFTSLFLLSPLAQYFATLAEGYGCENRPVNTQYVNISSSVFLCFITVGRFIIPLILCAVPFLLKTVLHMSELYFLILSVTVITLISVISVYRIIPLFALPWLLDSYPTENVANLILYAERTLKGRRTEFFILVLSYLPSIFISFLTLGISSLKSFPEILAAFYIFFMPTVKSLKS